MRGPHTEFKASALVWVLQLMRNPQNRTYLLGEVIEHGDISPPDHILALETADLLELWLLLVLLRVGLLASRVLHVGEVGVDAEAKVGWEGVRGGRPCEE
jgi:hypothetical protein